jgi:NAD(P)-dependent dehydrogenase (short-subunit alcohol dehydrogenase family)
VRHPDDHAAISGSRILVVGGSSGIGEGIATACSRLGGDVTIASRSPSKLAAAAQRIGADVTSRGIDICDDDSVRQFFATTDPYDHVVVSAASVSIEPVRVAAPSDAQRSMNSKFWGAYRIAHWATIMPAGSLTFISGAAAVRAAPGRALQRAMNAALEALAKGLALELSPVRVNAVSPGIVETAAWADADADRREFLHGTVAHTPLRRPGRPDEIARQVVACIENDFMTGSIIYVDGGYLA